MPVAPFPLSTQVNLARGEARLSKEALLRQLGENPYLPTPPGVALQVLERASRADCSISELSKLIARDPSLCSKMLRVVNSALFGLPHPVAAVDRAMQLLGLRRVRSLVLALSLPAMQQRMPAEQVRDFWRASVVGAMVRELAVRLPGRDPENELVAGLLRDVGVFAMQQVYAREYKFVHAARSQDAMQDQCELEERHIGLHHADVSAFLLERWRLPTELTQAIRFHHHPEQAPPAARQGAQILAFATSVAELQNAPGETQYLLRVLRQGQQFFAMQEHDIRKFFEPLARQIAEFGQLLHVDLGPFDEYANLLSKSLEELTRLVVETNLDNLRAQKEKLHAESERQRAESALQQAEEHLRQAHKLEAIGRLAAGVAHDFNNLLTVVTGFSEVLQGRLPADDPLQPLVEEIKRAGERGAGLTRQLLAFSRKQVLMPVQLQLNDVIADFQKMLRPLIGEDIRLVINLAADLFPIKADPGQLEQVLMNLTINARDAMPDGGELTVETRNVALLQGDRRGSAEIPPGTYAELVIRDTGTGMDSETLMHLFEPFFTTKDRGKGTGLGLATVYGIMKQSGGHISVRSEPGKGSEFFLLLPQPPNSRSISDDHSAIPVAFKGAETILLVEDEEAVRTISQRHLQANGYTVLSAQDAKEAAKLCRQHTGRIDLLLTDVVLPQQDGYHLAQELRAVRSSMQVLFMSGYVEDATRRLGLCDGNVPLLEKPFGAHALLRRVREVLEQPLASLPPL